MRRAELTGQAYTRFDHPQLSLAQSEVQRTP